MRYDWKPLLFSQLRRRAELRGRKVRFPVYFQGHEDRGVEVLLLGDALRVRVAPEALAVLGGLDEAAYLATLKDDAARRSWRSAARALRENPGATVNLHTYAVAVCMPAYNPRRRTPSLTVYESFCADPEDLVELLEPKQIAQLRAIRSERGRLPRLREMGEVLFPHPANDADAYVSEPLGDDDPFGGAPYVSLVDDVAEAESLEAESVWARHRNVIFFGPPGTGKSYTVEQIVAEHLQADEAHVVRATFHPEYGYFDFVGSYKPVVGWLSLSSSSAVFHDADGRSGDREPRAYYRFEPGPMSRALALAAANPRDPVVLVIEEINRGNTAAIFGDVFQLLDRSSGSRTTRDPVGWSEYAIHPSGDWAAWLSESVPSRSAVYDRASGRLRLPPNLYLYATMNTSDQGLYPMDTAFRRRWGMEYRGVDGGGDPSIRVQLHARDEVGVPWLALMSALNEAIVDYTHSDDKQVGPWFVKPTPGSEMVEAVEFKSKVLFYLWADVFRDEPTRVFRAGITTYEKLVARYAAGRSVFNEAVLAQTMSAPDPAAPDPSEPEPADR